MQRLEALEGKQNDGLFNDRVQTTEEFHSAHEKVKGRGSEHVSPELEISVNI